LIKKYSSYIKENNSFWDDTDLFDMDLYIDTYSSNLDELNNVLRAVLIGEVVSWIHKDYNYYRKEKVHSVDVVLDTARKIKIYLNGTPVHFEHDVKIFNSGKAEAIGYPSGEILYLNNDKLTKLLNANLISYENTMNNDKTREYFFYDDNYHDIQRTINPYYRKSNKKISNPPINDTIINDSDLEDHEIDDDYHIRQLYKTNSNNSYNKTIKVGDTVYIKDIKNALYNSITNKFVDISYSELDNEIGRVINIQTIKGIKCAFVIRHSNNIKHWYNLDCLKTK